MLDSLGGSAGLRGFLPFFNRFGQSVPPVLLSQRLAALPRKRSALAFYTAGMSACFLGLSMLWWFSIDDSSLAPYFFLVLYACFFVCKGMMDLAFGAIQGKLILPNQRGRLLMASNVIGAALAVLCAGLFLSRLISAEGGRFEIVFGFTALCFAIATVIAIRLSEPAEPSSPSRHRSRPVSDAISLLRTHRQFRLLCLIAFSFGFSMMLFPHYQALGRERLSLSFQSIVFWVIVQNIGTATFSIAIGLVADRFGNRLVLRGTLLGIGIMPLLALYLTRHPSLGVPFYSTVFILFGLTPVTIRIFSNFVLELAEPKDQPRFLSTLSICVAIPIYFSPLLGIVIDAVSYDLPMVCIAVAVFFGWALTFLIAEPRRNIEPPSTCADRIT